MLSSALLTKIGKVGHTVALLLIPFLIIGQYAITKDLVFRWKNGHLTEKTLWILNDEETEWNHALELVKGHNAMVLDVTGCAPCFAEGFQNKVTVHFASDVANEQDIQRRITQIDKSEYLLSPSEATVDKMIAKFPQLAAALAPFKEQMAGKYFFVYKR